MGGAQLHLRDYWDILVRRRMLIFVVFPTVVLLTLLFSYSMDPVYEATTTLQIDQDVPRMLNFDGGYPAAQQTEHFYQTHYRLLASKGLARRVIDSQGLLADPELSGSAGGLAAEVGRLPRRLLSGVRSSAEALFEPSEPANSPGTPRGDGTVAENASGTHAAGRYSGVMAAFLSRLEVTPVRNTRLVEVSWRSTDPEKAARIANGVAESYVDLNLENRYEATKQANVFLASEIEKLKGEIATAEEELQQYARDRNILAMNDRQDTVTQALNSLTADHIKAQNERIEKQVYYEKLRDQGPSAVPEAFSNEGIRELRSQLASLEERYTEMSARFKEGWPAMQRLRAQIDEVRERLSTEEQEIVEQAKNEYQMALSREQRLAGLIDRQRQEVQDLNRHLFTHRNLQIEIENKKDLLNSFLDRLSETGVSARLQGLGTSNIRTIEPAMVPTAPIKPDIQLNMALAALVGLVGGVMLAFFQEYMDNTVQGSEEAERQVGLPSLGVIPSLEAGLSSRYLYGYELEANGGPEIDEDTVPELLAATHPRSTQAEAFRTLRTSVRLSRATSAPKVLLVTSAQSREGKTTTSVNLATSIAQGGNKVLLIDGDLRRPRIHDIFGLEQEPGLVNFLAGDGEAGELIRSTPIDNLYVLPAGPQPPTPAELLSSEKMKELLEACREMVDAIIIDTSPITLVVDALEVATCADGILLVARCGQTPYPVLEQARKKLEEVGGPVLGLVLNDARVRQTAYYAYY